jgi:hypothetical protein
LLRAAAARPVPDTEHRGTRSDLPRRRERRSGAEGVTYLDDEASRCLGWRVVGSVAALHRLSTADQVLRSTTLECVPSPVDLRQNLATVEVGERPACVEDPVGLGRVLQRQASSARRYERTSARATAPVNSVAAGPRNGDACRAAHYVVHQQVRIPIAVVPEDDCLLTGADADVEHERPRCAGLRACRLATTLSSTPRSGQPPIIDCRVWAAAVSRLRPIARSLHTINTSMSLRAGMKAPSAAEP